MQLYIGDKVSSVTRPAKELKGFAKVFLAPGETREVTFEIGAEQLSFVGRNLEETVEEGEFDVMVGPHSADVQTVLLRVRGV